MRPFRTIVSASLGFLALSASTPLLASDAAGVGVDARDVDASRRVTSLRLRAVGQLQRLVEARLRVRVLARGIRTEGGPEEERVVYTVTLELANVEAVELRDVHVTVAGEGLEEATEHAVGSLAPGASTTLVVEYRSLEDGSRERLDPVWGENVPVSADVTFRVEGVVRAASVPVDYRFYAGWQAASVGDAALLGAAYAEQPGLLPIVEEIRRQVGEVVGPPPYATASARIRVAEAVSTRLRALGLTYHADPSYRRGERVALAYHQFPIETLYYGGDCEDIAILYAHILHALGVPFALASSVFHVAPLVELGRGELETSAEAEPFRSAVVTRDCGGERCLFLPVDLTLGLTQVDEDDDARWFAATVALAWKDLSGFDEQQLVFLSSRERPSGTVPVVGRSWLASMTFVPPVRR